MFIKKLLRSTAAVLSVLMLAGCSKDTGSGAAPPELPEDTRIDFSKGYVSISDYKYRYYEAGDPDSLRFYGDIIPDANRLIFYSGAGSDVGRLNCCFDIPESFTKVYDDKESCLMQYADPSGANIITVECWNGYNYDEVYKKLRHDLAGTYSEDNMKLIEDDRVGTSGYNAHTIYLKDESADKCMLIYVIQKPVEDDEYVRENDIIQYYTDEVTGEKKPQIAYELCFTYAIEGTAENIEGLAKTILTFVTTEDDMTARGIELGVKKEDKS
ncbi:MAG: hypothetical protein IJ874_03740 [Ruminococcus sp.]|nr:hypothetical protein [Ruminococcus sp.]